MIRRRRPTGFQIELAQGGRSARLRRGMRAREARTAQDQARRGFERTIPASGSGRRRAKALRNKRAMVGDDE